MVTGREYIQEDRVMEMRDWRNIEMIGMTGGNGVKVGIGLRCRNAFSLALSLSRTPHTHRFLLKLHFLILLYSTL